MLTYIIADTDDLGVLFRVSCPVKGLSPIYRIEGRSNTEGNPYSLYGKKAEEWTGTPWMHLCLAVATITSGHLE